MGTRACYDSEELNATFYYSEGRVIRIRNGKFADESLDRDGYRIVFFKSASLRAHRVVWVLCGNDLPEKAEIDHINGDRGDNRIENLRLASHIENSRNRKTYTTNKSGKKGVYYHEGKKRWQVYVDGELKGSYMTQAHATKMRDYFAKKSHGEFFRESETDPQSAQSLQDTPPSECTP